MHVLIHIGLNKCASTYVQYALDSARSRLRQAGTWYPEQDGPPCQYGLSQHYGFGPNAAEIAPQTLAGLVGQARHKGCDRLIVSSEYLSLYNPGAVRRLLLDIETLGINVQLAVLTRSSADWIRSLFNQYVKTVDGGPLFPTINAFVDQVFANGAIDLNKRLGQWSCGIGWDNLRRYQLGQTAPCAAAISPFEEFAGVTIPAPSNLPDNRSLSADHLWTIANMRQEPPSEFRDKRLAHILAGGATRMRAPDGYLDISATNQDRLRALLVDAMRGFPIHPLPLVQTARAS